MAESGAARNAGSAACRAETRAGTAVCPLDLWWGRKAVSGDTVSGRGGPCFGQNRTDGPAGGGRVLACHRGMDGGREQGVWRDWADGLAAGMQPEKSLPGSRPGAGVAGTGGMAVPPGRGGGRPPVRPLLHRPSRPSDALILSGPGGGGGGQAAPGMGLSGGTSSRPG